MRFFNRIPFRWLLLLTIVALFIAGSTMSKPSKAWYEDSGGAQGMNLGTATADLKLKDRHGNWVDQGPAGQFGIVPPQNLYPGQATDGKQLQIRNFSTPGINLDVYATVISSDNDAQNDLMMKIGWNGNATGTGFHTMKWWEEHSEMLGSPLSGKRTLAISYNLKEDAGNSTSGAQYDFELRFIAKQSQP